MITIITGVEVLNKYSTQVVADFCLKAHEDLSISIEKIDINLKKLFNLEPLDGDLTTEEIRLLNLIHDRMQIGINDAHSYLYSYVSQTVAIGSGIFKTLVMKIAIAEISLSGWATLGDISEMNSMIIADRLEAIDIIKELVKTSSPNEVNVPLIGKGVVLNNQWK